VKTKSGGSMCRPSKPLALCHERERRLSRRCVILLRRPAQFNTRWSQADWESLNQSPPPKVSMSNRNEPALVPLHALVFVSDKLV
jgi:hypothetical protein